METVTSVVLTFESVDETFTCERSGETSAVLSCDAVCFEFLSKQNLGMLSTLLLVRP